MDAPIGSPSSIESSNLYGEKIEVPGGPDDPNMKDGGDGELNPANSILLKDPQQQYLYAVETIRQLRARLIRRTNVIDEIRKFYLRDIVSMRHIIKEVLTEPEREIVWREYDTALPSIDLSQMLKLHAPSKGEFRITPCEKCGGQLEIVTKDTDEVEALKKIISDSKDRENRWREKLATLDAQIESATLEKAESSKAHMEEKRVLYAEMKKLRESTEKSKNEATQYAQMHKKIKDEYDAFKKKNADLFEAQRKVELLEQELYSAKSNIEEKEESIKNLKTLERTLSKELQLTKETVDELSKEREMLEDDLTAAKDENKSLQNTLASINVQLKQTEVKLEEVQAENKEIDAKLQTTQNEALDMRIAHTQAMEACAHEIDTLKFELKELTVTFNQADNDLEANKKELNEAMAKIDELTELNKQLEMELLDSADEIELFEEEIAAMQQFIREKISANGDGDSDDEDLMREFEEQFRGKLDEDEDDDEDEEDDADDELDEEKEDSVVTKDSEIKETPTESIENTPKVKKQKSAVKKEKSVRGKIEKVGSRALSTKVFDNPDLPPADDNGGEKEENEAEEEEEKADVPTDYRQRRRAMARKSSMNRNGSFRANGNSGAAMTSATLRKQIRTNSVLVSPSKPLKTIASNDESVDKTEGTIDEKDEVDDNSTVETAPNNATVDDGPVDVLAEVSRRKKKARARKSSISGGSNAAKGSSNSKRASNAKKRRSVAADTPRSVEDSIDGAGIMKLIDPEALMALNHRESFFGVPNERRSLQRIESLRRRRSIPRDFVYYELVKSPSEEKLVSTQPDPSTTKTNPDTTTTTEFKRAQRALDKNFTLHTREILTNTKGRIENIKSMLQETPPTTARSLKSAGGGGGSDKKRRKTKRKEAVVEDSDHEEETEQTEQVDTQTTTQTTQNSTEEAKQSRPSSTNYQNKKPPSGQKKADGTPQPRATKIVVPQVELIPPPEDATKFELALRQCLLTIIRNTKGMNENFTHTVVNGITPFLHTVSKEVTDLLHSLWQALFANKTSLDFLEKLSTVFKGIMSLMTPDATTLELADVCAQVVPLAGATLNAAVTQQWQEVVQMDEEVLLSLLPTVVNYGTGERRNKSIEEFLEEKIHIFPYNPKIATSVDKHDPNNPNLNHEGIDETIYQYFPKFSQLKTSIGKMHDQTVFMNTMLSENFIEVLRDWSSAKTIYLELEKRLDTEREKTKKPLDMKIATISKELNKMTALYEKNTELIRNLEIKLKEYEKYEIELKNCELKLIDTQSQLDTLINEHTELKREHHELIELKDKLFQEIQAYEQLVDKLQHEIADHKTEITQLKQRIAELEEALRSMTEERDNLQAKLDHMLFLEDRRLNKIIAVSIQTEPLVHDIGLQTEFFVPPMDLKTVVVNKLSRSGLNKYPLVFSQSLEFLPNLRHEQGTDASQAPAPQKLHQPMPHSSPRHHTVHVFPTPSANSVGSVSIADELRHPLAVGLNANYTNTNALNSKLKTNDALANKSLLLTSSSLNQLQQNQPTTTNSSTSMTTPNNPPFKRHSFLRSDSATSTDSLQFNFTEFKAQPPLIRYHYNSSQSQSNNSAMMNHAQSYPGIYLENSIFEGDESASGNNSQQHQYYHSPMLMDQDDEMENQQFSEYGNQILDTYTQATGTSNPDDLMLGEESYSNNNIDLGSAKQSREGGDRGRYEEYRSPQYQYQSQNPAQANQGPLSKSPSHGHSMPKLFKSSSFHPPPQQLKQNAAGSNSLNQSSILTVSTLQGGAGSFSPQKEGTVGFESSIESQQSSTTKLIGQSVRKSNQHQDIIDGIIYNHRANNHYNNLLYKTNTLNDALAVSRVYEQYHQVAEENLDSLSITSLSQANAKDREKEREKAANNRIVKSSLNQMLPQGLRPPSINTGNVGGTAGSAGYGNNNQNNNNSAAMSAAMKKKLFFPEIGGAPTGSGHLGQSHGHSASSGHNRSNNSTAENTIKRLQKELF